MARLNLGAHRLSYFMKNILGWLHKSGSHILKSAMKTLNDFNSFQKGLVGLGILQHEFGLRIYGQNQGAFDGVKLLEDFLAVECESVKRVRVGTRNLLRTLHGLSLPPFLPD